MSIAVTMSNRPRTQVGSDALISGMRIVANPAAVFRLRPGRNIVPTRLAARDDAKFRLGIAIYGSVSFLRPLCHPS